MTDPALPGDRDVTVKVPALRFRWLTPIYDTVVRLTTRERTVKAALMEQARIAPGQRVLDLACGTGTLAIWLKTAMPDVEVHGIDGDPAILRIAKDKAERAGVDVVFAEAMSNALPFPGDHFDRVLSSLFFHHIDAYEKARTAREVIRVLKSRGEFHVADWGQAENLAMRLLFVPVQILDGVGNTRDNVRGRLPSIFEQAGFATRQTGSFSTVLGTLSLYQGSLPGNG